jgi:hypothetical protein
MGIDAAGAQFLLAAKRAGVSFARTATIGKQTLFLTGPGLEPLVRAFGLPRNAEETAARCGRNGDAFLSLLGAESVTSIDVSDYQGATVLHDMNEPVGDSLKERFSLVLDAGSLEHVFDVRQAIKNCMDLLEVGGHFIGITTGNNFLGHGFYQFSPEFYFRVFAPANGFQTECVLLATAETDPPEFYRVDDPVTVGGRVELVNDCPIYLLVLARKTARVPVFSVTPQQSDYVAVWQGAAAAHSRTAVNGNGQAGLLRRCAGLLPAGVKDRIRRSLGVAHPHPRSLGQPCFHPLSLEEMAAGQMLAPARPGVL